MPQTQNKDRRHQDNLTPEQRSEIGRKGGEARGNHAQQNENPGSGTTNSAIGRRTGGQGEVRSEHDRRLEDNLDPQQRSEIGRKGGEAVSQDREHMAEIGRKGGQKVSQDREHMAEIGQKGGRA